MKKLLLATSITGLLATSSLAGGGGDIFRSSLVVDQLEYQLSNEKATIWDVYGYAGYDINKVYIILREKNPKMNLLKVKTNWFIQEQSHLFGMLKLV